MFRVSRPMLVVVLKAWVTEMKETPCVSNSSTNLAKSASDRGASPPTPASGAPAGSGDRVVQTEAVDGSHE